MKAYSLDENPLMCSVKDCKHAAFEESLRPGDVVGREGEDLVCPACVKEALNKGPFKGTLIPVTAAITWNYRGPANNEERLRMKMLRAGVRGDEYFIEQSRQAWMHRPGTGDGKLVPGEYVQIKPYKCLPGVAWDRERGFYAVK